eukprot:1196232-Prorocentrum_minimum.AAC.2
MGEPNYSAVKNGRTKLFGSKTVNQGLTGRSSACALYMRGAKCSCERSGGESSFEISEFEKCLTKTLQRNHKIIRIEKEDGADVGT